MRTAFLFATFVAGVLIARPLAAQTDVDSEADEAASGGSATFAVTSEATVGAAVAAPAVPDEEHASFSERPWIALEVSGAGAFMVNPWIQHQGWEYKSGPGGGVRVEAHLLGISLGYGVDVLGNKEVCGVGCVSGGDFGSTQIQSLNLGYRLRLPLGRIRPIAEVGVGGLMANAGDWSKSTNKTVYGVEGRAGAGVEINFGAFFASVRVVYRYFVTENPAYDETAEKINAAFLGATPDVKDKIEDGHLLGVLVGLGVGLY